MDSLCLSPCLAQSWGEGGKKERGRAQGRGREEEEEEEEDKME